MSSFLLCLWKDAASTLHLSLVNSLKVILTSSGCYGIWWGVRKGPLYLVTGENKLSRPPGQPHHCVPTLNTITIGDLNSSITATWVRHPIGLMLTCAKQALARTERWVEYLQTHFVLGRSFVPLHLLSILAFFVVVEFCFETRSHIAQACLEPNV